MSNDRNLEDFVTIKLPRYEANQAEFACLSLSMDLEDRGKNLLAEQYRNVAHSIAAQTGSNPEIVK